MASNRLTGCIAILSLMTGASNAVAQPPKDDAFFGPTVVHKLHLELTAAEWAKMQPPAKGGFPGFGPKPAPAPKVEGADVHRSATFGNDFPWVKADLNADGAAFANIGVRFKGNFTYIASAQGLRRPLKIDLDHYDDDAPRLAGQRKLNLANGVTDPARLRESLAFSVYRAAGIPAPRTAYAELTLTIPGKYAKEYVGLYTAIEQIDKTFLKSHFKSAKGLLLKPENLRGGIEYLGDEWAKYEDKYRPKYDATAAQKQRLIAFTRLIHKADDADFYRDIGDFLDIDAFVRFVAADALMANLDSYLGFGHNFYLYLRPDTNRFVFMPWDLDLSMGMWPVGGPPEKQMDLSLEHPHIGQNKLLDRVFRHKEFKDKYLVALKDLTTTCFVKEKLFKDIDAIEAAVQDALAREKIATAARKETTKGPFAGIVAQGPPLRQWVEKRTESVLAQLDGKRPGYIPASMGFPGAGVPKGPPGGFGPGQFLAKPFLQATGKNGRLSREDAATAAKTFFAAADKDAAGSLTEPQLAAALSVHFPQPPNAPPRPAAFAPGPLLAASIFLRADPAKTGKITRDDFLKAADALFRELDTKNAGHIEEAAIAAGVNQLFSAARGLPPRTPLPK